MDRVPGADTLGFGFDITKTYDKSSTTQRIFKEGKPDDSTMTIGKTTYAVPQNIGVEPVQDTDGGSMVKSTRQEVQEYFSAKAGVSGSGFGFTGQFDAAYSYIQKRDCSYFYALVEATTHNYNLKLKEQRGEWYTSDFASDVKDLPATFDKSTEEIFFMFFGTYGTHYVHQVKLGGSLYYYVAIEKSSSSVEKDVQANLSLEYEGVFASSKVEAESKWKQLGQDWAKNRTVKVVTRGGENTLDGISPGFNAWKGEAFKAWTQSLIEKPGLSGFNLQPISKAVPLAKRAVVEKALLAYLRGGVIVKADRDFTPQTTRRAYTAYPTIIGPDGVIAPPSPMPEPARREEDVTGIQVTLFDADTHKVILNKVYYATPPNPQNVGAMYDQLKTDIGTVTASDYFCALSVFGLSPIYYPPAAISGWLGSCGAKLTEWQKHIGSTGDANGVICYTLAGRRGGGGAKEDLVFDPYRNIRKLNSTSPYFLHGAGVLKVAQS